MGIYISAADVIATCSVLVALLAFFATAWQGWLAHRHNRLSVRPHLVWHISRRNSQGSSGIAFSLRNLGLGPAVVRERYFTKNGARFKPPSMKTDEVPAFIAFALDPSVSYVLRSFGLPGKDSAIPSQGEIVIADLEFFTTTSDQLKIIGDMAGQLAFHVRYESMYEESFELHVF